MNCEEASGLIKPFIDDTIEDDVLLGQYLNHICGCKNCYEELDVMYIVSAGLDGLHTDKEVSFDFTGALAGKIEQSKKSIHKNYVKKKRLIMIDIGCIIIILAVIGTFILDFFI